MCDAARTYGNPPPTVTAIGDDGVVTRYIDAEARPDLG